MSRMSDAERQYREAVNRAKAPGPNPKLGDKSGPCSWRLCARHARLALVHLLARRTALSARHGARSARYALALAPVLAVFLFVLLVGANGAPVSAQEPTSTPMFAPTPGLVDEPPILGDAAVMSWLYLPAIISTYRPPIIGEPLPPATPTAPPVVITPVPTSTPTATPTATPEPTGTPFLVTPSATPVLVDVPVFHWRHAQDGADVHATVTVCNHTWGEVLVTPVFVGTYETGGTLRAAWDGAPVTVPSGDCVTLAQWFGASTTIVSASVELED